MHTRKVSARLSYCQIVRSVGSGYLLCSRTTVKLSGQWVYSYPSRSRTTVKLSGPWGTHCPPGQLSNCPVRGVPGLLSNCPVRGVPVVLPDSCLTFRSVGYPLCSRTSVKLSGLLGTLCAPELLSNCPVRGVPIELPDFCQTVRSVWYPLWSRTFVKLSGPKVVLSDFCRTVQSVVTRCAPGLLSNCLVREVPIVLPDFFQTIWSVGYPLCSRTSVKLSSP